MYPSIDGIIPSFAAVLFPVKIGGLFPSQTNVQSLWAVIRRVKFWSSPSGCRRTCVGSHIIITGCLQHMLHYPRMVCADLLPKGTGLLFVTGKDPVS